MPDTTHTLMLEAMLLEAVLRYQAHRDRVRAVVKSLEPCEEEAHPWDFDRVPPQHEIGPCWKRRTEETDPSGWGTRLEPDELCPACNRNVPAADRLHRLRAQTGGYASQVAQLARRVLRERDRV